mmetsp:Transcript_24107/g.50898  ORF Transcript_24107/g.50898 Transcript_24107/m.50898 type:complete len:82 (-) Transcript_24107:419-664(-)
MSISNQTIEIKDASMSSLIPVDLCFKMPKLIKSLTSESWVLRDGCGLDTSTTEYGSLEGIKEVCLFYLGLPKGNPCSSQAR